jgi:hypothetical protein
LVSRNVQSTADVASAAAKRQGIEASDQRNDVYY